MRQAVGPKLDNFIEVEGLVLPAEWDELGRPSAFKISSPGELNYLIVDDKMGRQMKHHLRQYIRVLGRIEGSNVDDYKIAVERILQHE